MSDQATVATTRDSARPGGAGAARMLPWVVRTCKQCNNEFEMPAWRRWRTCKECGRR